MRSPTFRRILIANLLLLFLLAGVVGGSFWYSRRAAVEESTRAGLEQLRKLSEVVDGEIRIINAMLFAISKNARFSNLAALREYSPVPGNTLTIAGLRELLQMAKRSREYYEEVYVFFPKIGIYVSTDGLSNERVFDSRINQSATPSHLLMSSGDTPLVVIRQAIVAPIGSTYLAAGRRMMIHEYRTLTARIAIVVDPRAFAQLLDRSLGASSASFAARFPGTRVPYAAAGPWRTSVETWSSEAEATDLAPSNEDMLFRSPSESSGLQYELLVSRDTLASRLYSLRIAALALLVILIVLDLLIFLMLKTRVYQPLRDLVASVSGTDSDAGIDEYEILTDSFARMQARLTLAQERLLRQEQEARYLIPKKVRSRYGGSNGEDDPDTYEFVVVTVVVEGGAHGRDDRKLDRIVDNSIELLGAVEVFGHSEPRSLYVPVSDSESETEAVRRVLSPFQTDQVLILAGISEVFTQLRDAGKAFKQSVRALDMHSFGASEAGLQVEVYDRSRADRFHVQLVTPKYERSFVVALTIGDERTAIEQINKVFTKIGSMPRRGISENARYLGDLIYSVALRHDPTTPAFDISYFDIFDSVYRPSSFQAHLIDAAQKVCRAEKNRHQDAVANVLRVLRENYTDPQFSIEDLASRTRMSSGYVSRLISGNTGRTFTEHLTQLRITAAVQMLNDTPLLVKEVAQRAGFPSVDTFIRSFKRQHGTTPERYRRHVPRTLDNQ